MVTRLSLLMCCLATLMGAAADTPISGTIESAGLFKNGMALVTQVYPLPGPGRFMSEPIRNAVHGTLWIESEAVVLARLETTLVDQISEDALPGGSLEQLRGKMVRLHLRGEGERSLEGRLLSLPRFSEGAAIMAASPTPMYGVGLDDGRQRFVSVDNVTGVESLEAVVPDDLANKVKKDVLVFEVEVAEGPVQVRATYLTRGLSWAPAYRLGLGGAGRLTIAQSATIRNELADFENAKLALISGYPSVEFQQVTSPFASGMRWDTFFSQLAGGSTPGFGGVATQMIISNNADFIDATRQPGAPLPELPANYDVDDLYYHPIGEHGLNTGDALFLEVASADTTFEPVVEWSVPENLTAAENQQVDLWDCIRFHNPFAFPMTTGPAMIVEDGEFLGSRMSPWVNPGAETLVRVGKALSITVGATESEISRVETRQLDRSYWESTVAGALNLINRRPEAAEIVVRKSLTGLLLDSNEEPLRSVGSDGPGQLNASTELTWKIVLAPGEKRELTYRYSYLSR